MARSVGHYFELGGRGYYRLSRGDARPCFALGKAGPEARERGEAIARIVLLLRQHEASAEMEDTLAGDAAKATSPEELEALLIIARDVGDGVRTVTPRHLASTSPFGDLVDCWLKNELHTAFPDHVRKLKPGTASDYASLYANYIERTLGHLPIAGITVDHAFSAMQQVPAGAQSNSLRVNAGIVIARPLRLAVFPLRLLAASPLPAGFSPRKKRGRAKVYLYPSEDRELLRCREIPLVLRLFYGMLAREGLRVEELSRLTISDFDLVHGVVVLDKNKTDEPRSWALAPGTKEALVRYLDRFHPNPKSGERMFLFAEGPVDPAHVADCIRGWIAAGVGVRRLAERLGVTPAAVSYIVRRESGAGPKVVAGFLAIAGDPELPPCGPAPRARTDGLPLVALARATTFRDNLVRAGLVRAQLYENDETRRHIVIHDLRATFVTVHLAQGKAEAWITDRTGHRSSEMLYRYKREARTHAELGLGPLAPLLECLPELQEGGAVQPNSRRTPPNVLSTEQLTDSESVAISASYSTSKGRRTKLQRLDSNPPADASHVVSGPKSPTTKDAGAPKKTGFGRHLAETVQAGDRVGALLEAAIEKATRERDWALARELAGELEARTTARQAPNVVPIEGRRKSE